jgi:tetratricopeptide (TPR) repeat protein
MGQLDEAETLLRQAWRGQTLVGPLVHIKLLQNIALLRFYQKQYTKARIWLKRAEAFLQKTSLPEPEQTRRLTINLHYHGLCCYKQHDFEQAESYLRRAIEHAEAIGWQRSHVHAQNWLVGRDIAHGKLDEARQLLEGGLDVCERNKDRRRAAHYMSGLAYLNLKQRNVEEARRWAMQALGDFESLRMRTEAREMHKLLRTIHR